MTAQIITGDALELIQTLDDGSVQLVVTSPPYPGQYGNTMDGREWLEWMRGLMTGLIGKLTPNAVIVINAQFKRLNSGYFDSRLMELPAYLEAFELLDVYIYGKSNPPPNGALTCCDPPGWEFIFVLTNAIRPDEVIFNPIRKPYSPRSVDRNGRLYSNMSRGDIELHPDGARQTTLMLMSGSGDQGRPKARGISFPRALPERFIRQYTNPGDLVLDPFAGVGTTIRVAQELGRRAIGFEINPKEADRAREWLARPVQPALSIMEMTR